MRESTHRARETFTRVNHLVSAVGSTPTLIVEAHPRRVAWSVINLGTAAMYVGFDSDVSASRGILVQGSGGFIGFTEIEDHKLPTLPAFAIVPGGTSPVYVIETIEK
jgi:hypothetical protein